MLATLTSDDHPYLLYAVVGGILGLAAVARNVLGSVKDWHELRQRHTGEQWATMQDLRDVHGRVDNFAVEIGKIRGEVIQSIDAFGERVAKSLSNVSEQLHGVQRSLGRVEGLEKVIEEHSRDIDQLQSGASRSSRPR